jgi:hypothetical protein
MQQPESAENDTILDGYDDDSLASVQALARISRFQQKPRDSSRTPSENCENSPVERARYGIQ